MSLSLASILTALASLLKFEVTGVKTGDITGIRDSKIDITGIKDVRELRCSLIDKSSQAHNITVNNYTDNHNTQNVTVLLGGLEQKAWRFSLPDNKFPDNSIVAVTSKAALSSSIDDSLAEHAMSIDTGINIIINNQKWFQNELIIRPNINRCIIPIKEEATDVLIPIENENRNIRVRFKDRKPESIYLDWTQEDLPMTPWLSFTAGNSKWTLREVSIEHPIFVEEDGSILLTCSKKIVETVWWLDRIHTPRRTTGTLRPPKAYILIINKSSNL